MLLSASPTFVALPLGGLVDTNFGSGGIAIGPSAAPTEYVATQADGKIVVLSESLGVTQLYDVVTRFNADGTLDTTFGNGGSVVTSLRSDSGASLESSLAIQADGKIVVVGDNDAAYGPDHGAVLLRLNSDGSIDTSFGANGMVVTHFGDMLGQGLAVFAESDGKLLEIGHRDWTYSQGERVGGNVALALFNADGTLDTTFGSGGIVDCSGPADISVACAQLQPDGKILLGGSTSLGAARYD